MTTPSAERSARLRALLADGTVAMPGAINALSAKLIERAGFEAMYLSGAVLANSVGGVPDTGLMTLSESEAHSRHAADACSLPILADADTGYGGPENAARTVRVLERAGVSAIHLEDQEFPKRCGHLEGKTLIAPEEMAAHIRAACDARLDDDFVVIARTDAIAVEGFERAMERAKIYEEAGADVLFVEAPRTMEQLEAIPKGLGVPALYNMASSGKTPFLTADEMQELGFRLVIYPNFMLMAAIPAMTRVLQELKRSGSVKGMLNDVVSFQEFFDLMGMDQVKELEARYQVSEDARAGY